MKNTRNLKESLRLVKQSQKNLNMNDNFTIDWIIPNLIGKNKIVQVYGQSGSGKSMTALAWAIYALESNTIDEVVYIDADNGGATVQSRNIKAITEKYADKFYYPLINKPTEVEDIDPYKIIYDLAKSAKIENPQRTMIIFDSLLYFFDGNISKNNEIRSLCKAFTTLRPYYACVMFLNHQPKPNSYENTETELGGSILKATCDAVYHIKTFKRDNNTLITTAKSQKQRDDVKSIATIFNSDTLEVKLDDFMLYDIDDKKALTLEYAKEIIEQNPKGLSRNQLIKAIFTRAKEEYTEVCGGNAMRELLLDFNNKLYSVKNGSNNSFMFYPLEIF